MSSFRVTTFYKFAELTNVKALQHSLTQLCKEKMILGTILLAEEGINATIAGTDENIKAVLSFIRSAPPLKDLKCKDSFSDVMPFRKLKILIKKEIVKLEVPGINPSEHRGVYVKPESWNALISNSDVLVVDTRNTYEIDLGTFKNAQNPKTRKFREFPAYVHNHLQPDKQKKIALFCTGGIRCEKASAYLLEQGFENVYQLEGGILKYLEKIPCEESLWEGKCFIFDDRVTVEKDSIHPPAPSFDGMAPFKES